MTTVQEEIQAAHHLGKDLGRHRKACDAMLQIATRADIDPQTRADCFHQAGVYALNSGRLEDGSAYLKTAQRLATNDTSKGNILRDLARYFYLGGDFSSALACCNEALELHGSRSEAGIMDRSFKGRILFERGYKERELTDRLSGLRYLRLADEQLQALNSEDARRLELYNKLHLASAVARVHGWEAWQFAHDSLVLAKAHGNWQHRLRARALLRFGWRGEQTTLKLLKTGQQLRNSAARFKR